jgi:hypothetical protein
MKAITLWQPWASLLAKGPKKYETRSWKTNHRGWVAIHAAQRFDPLVTNACYLFERELLEIGLSPLEVPRGVVVGVGKLSSIVYCSDALRASSLIPDLDTVEAYGDYSSGRFAWVFTEMIPVDPPIAAIGRQGIWSWDEPGKIQLIIGGLDKL